MKHIGENIRILRQGMEFTLAELSEKIDIQESPLGRIERGLNAPSAKVLQNLSNVLGVSIDTLFEENKSKFYDKVNNELGNALFISYKRKEQDNCKEDINKAEETIDLLLELENICNAQKYANIPLQLPFTKTASGMVVLSQNLRYFMQIRQGISLNYFELIESCGFRITALPLSNSKSLSFYDKNNLNGFIFINSKLSLHQQCYQLIYEVAMIYLWCNNIANSAKDNEFFEDELAHQFVKDFLLPRDVLIRTLKRIGITSEQWSHKQIVRFSQRFGVSMEFFMNRLNEFKMISPALFEKFKYKLVLDNSNGFNNEKTSDMINIAQFNKDQTVKKLIKDIEDIIY